MQEVQISLKMQVIFVSASHCAILSFTSPQSQRSLQLQTKEWKSASLHFCLEKANQTGAWDHACLGTSCRWQQLLDTLQAPEQQVMQPAFYRISFCALFVEVWSKCNPWVLTASFGSQMLNKAKDDDVDNMRGLEKFFNRRFFNFVKKMR